MNYQKLLYSIKFSKWLSHLKLVLNTDESVISRNTKINYSWGVKGIKKPLNNIKFSSSLSIISTISTTGKWYNYIKVGTIKASDFIEYIGKMVETMKGTSQIENNQIGIILDNCAVHSAKVTIKALKDIGVNVYFIPPYCPELAPIEKYFSILKNLVLTKWDANSLNLKTPQGIELIEDSIQEIKECWIRSLWIYYFDEVEEIISSHKNQLKINRVLR